MCYCDIRENEMNINTKLKPNNSKTHKLREKCGIGVKEYEIKKPKIDGIEYSFDDIIKNCGEKLFHTFKFRCVYAIKSTKMAHDEVIKLRSTLEYMCFTSEIYGLKKMHEEMDLNVLR